jgi:hypothetical protein
MTYGIKVLNDFGEQVFGMEKSLVIKETGITSSSIACGMTQFFSPSWDFMGPRTLEIFTYSGANSGTWAGWQNYHPHFMKSQTAGFQFSAFSRHPTPLVDPSSLYFYKIGTIGLAHHSEHTISPPWDAEHGMFAVCVPCNNEPLPFLRVDALPATGLTGNYGMQIRDSDGSVNFDSRAQFLSISEVLLVPKATMQNILDNNAVVNLTLRTPVPGAYVAAPNHTSFYQQSGATGLFMHVAIEQTDPTTIRLRRYNHPLFLNTSREFGVNNDLVIIVARDPLV